MTPIIQPIPTPRLFWKAKRGIPLLFEEAASSVDGLISFVRLTPFIAALKIDSGNSQVDGIQIFSVTTPNPLRSFSDAEQSNMSLVYFMVNGPVIANKTDSANSTVSGVTAFMSFTPVSQSAVDSANSTVSGLQTFLTP